MSRPDSLPLAGVRVVDLSRLLPGPLCSQMLADLGAEVIKVEDDVGDYIRYFQPVAGDGNSAQFHAINRGKKSVKLNLKSQKDKALFMQLLANSDVLLESFRPGVMDKLGLSPNSLLQKFPHLIICSLTGFGHTGPQSRRVGHDIGFLARAGVLDLMDKPSLLPLPFADIAGGSLPAAMQICAALYQRTRTGRGCFIDVSIVDNTAALLLPLTYAGYSATGQYDRLGSGLLTGGLPNYRVYEAKDNTYLAVGTLEPKFWKTFVDAIGMTELRDKWADPSSALKLGERLKAKTAQEWMQYLKSKGVADEACVEAVTKLSDLTSDPQLQARGIFVQVPIPSSGCACAAPDQRLELLGSPFRIQRPGADASSHTTASSTSSDPSKPSLGTVSKPGPALGQHNDEILGSLRMEEPLSLTRSML